MTESHSNFLCTRDQWQLKAIQENFPRNLTLGLLRTKYSLCKRSYGFVTYIATHSIFIFIFYFQFFKETPATHAECFVFISWLVRDILTALSHILPPSLLSDLVEHSWLSQTILLHYKKKITLHWMWRYYAQQLLSLSATPYITEWLWHTRISSCGGEFKHMADLHGKTPSLQVDINLHTH